MPTRLLATLTFLLLTINAQAQETSEAPGMKCGAGKCGANMFDGNAALAKKKRNLLSQMRDDDSRKDCVIQAPTTKAAYDCVRDPNGKKLTTKCGTGKCGANTSAMKCGAGKCGDAMKRSGPVKEPAMRCGAGKCGSPMKAAAPTQGSATKSIKLKKSAKAASGTKCGASNREKVLVQQPVMRCGAGKCGASMKAATPAKKPAMKCGAGKCGGR